VSFRLIDIEVTGPLTISGGSVNATIVGTPSVNVGTITTLQAGTVDVTNVVSTNPVIDYTALVTNNSAANISVPNLGAYRSVVIKWQTSAGTSSGNYQNFVPISVTLSKGGLILRELLLYAQYEYGSSSGAPQTSDTLYSKIPLDGADTMTIAISAIAGMTTTTNVYGTNDALPLQHRSDNWTNNLGAGNSGIESVTTTNSVFVPIPITSNPIQIATFISSTGSVGAPSAAILVADSKSQGARPVSMGSLAKGANTYTQLPHALNPMYFVLQNTAGSSTAQIFWSFIEGPVT